MVNLNFNNITHKSNMSSELNIIGVLNRCDVEILIILKFKLVNIHYVKHLYTSMVFMC